MKRVLPGICQLQLPIPDNPLEYTNTYLIQGDGEALLIDAGWNGEEALRSLKEQLTEIGIGFEDVSQIVITHAHIDHYGLAGRLRQLSRAKIALHYLEKELINARNMDMAQLLQQMRQWLLTNGVPASELIELQRVPLNRARFAVPVLPDVVLRGSEIISMGIFNFQVVWTPGHSPGHICLYEPTQKILFSGDHILPVITPNVSLQPQSDSNPLGNFLESLDKVKQLDVNLVLPAHEHIFTGLPARVEEITQHHKQRNWEILETIKTEPKTAYQISDVITWMPELGGVKFRDLASWDKRMAVSEALAHLESMRIDGRVYKFLKDDIIYYRHT